MSLRACDARRPAGAAHAQPARYEIDPDHFSVGFLVDHIGYAKVLGLFQTAGGTFAFDEKTATLADVAIAIDSSSVFTGHRKRDNHLRSADFLNSAEFPKIVFKGGKAKRTGERTFVVDGQLELLGKTEPCQLRRDLEQERAVRAPRGQGVRDGRVGARQLQAQRLGMNYGVANGWVGDTVELIVEFEARRK